MNDNEYNSTFSFNTSSHKDKHQMTNEQYLENSEVEILERGEDKLRMVKIENIDKELSNIL